MENDVARSLRHSYIASKLVDVSCPQLTVPIVA